MNRTLTDPTLRTFRQPIAHRLRLRIDELRDVIHARDKTIKSQTRQLCELEAKLRKAERETTAWRAHARHIEAQLIERG